MHSLMKFWNTPDQLPIHNKTRNFNYEVTDMATDIKNSSKDIKVVLVENLNFSEVVILKTFQEKQMYVVQCQ